MLEKGPVFHEGVTVKCFCEENTKNVAAMDVNARFFFTHRLTSVALPNFHHV